MLSKTFSSFAIAALLGANATASVIDYFYATESDGALTTDIRGYTPMMPDSVTDYTLLFEWTAEYYALTHIAINASVLLREPTAVSDIVDERGVILALYNST